MGFKVSIPRRISDQGRTLSTAQSTVCCKDDCRYFRFRFIGLGCASTGRFFSWLWTLQCYDLLPHQSRSNENHDHFEISRFLVLFEPTRSKHGTPFSKRQIVTPASRTSLASRQASSDAAIRRSASSCHRADIRPSTASRNGREGTKRHCVDCSRRGGRERAQRKEFG